MLCFSLSDQMYNRLYLPLFLPFWIKIELNFTIILILGDNKDILSKWFSNDILQQMPSKPAAENHAHSNKAKFMSVEELERGRKWISTLTTTHHPCLFWIFSLFLTPATKMFILNLFFFFLSVEVLWLVYFLIFSTCVYLKF